jgi:signal transduction histidine kinase
MKVAGRASGSARRPAGGRPGEGARVVPEFFHSMKLRITAVLVFMLGGVLLVQARVLTPRIQREAVAAAKTHQSELADQIAQNLGASFQRAIDELEALARQPEVRSSDQEQLDRFLTCMSEVTAHFNYYFVMDTAGVWLSFPTLPELVGLSVPDENMGWVRRTFAEDRTVFLDVVRSRVQTLVSGFSTPIRGEQGRAATLLRGVMLLSDRNPARDLITETRVGEHGQAYIVSSNGRLIAHPNIDPDPADFNDLDYSGYLPVARVIQGQAGLVEYEYDDQHWIAAYQPIPVTGWGVIVQQPQADVLTPAGRYARLVGHVVVLAFLLSAALAAAVIQLTLRPLGRLVRGLAAGQPPSGDNYPRDEVGQLAREFADLYADLQRSQQQLRESRERYRRLSEELDDRVRQRTAQLEAANREIASFAYSVSHDLRAPLRGIDGFSQILLEDHADRLDEAGRDALGRVRAATRRMGELIDGLLKLSRLTRGELRYERVDLSRMAREVAAELEREAPRRRVAWVITEGLTVVGDRELLRIVLVNLLGNAWKFTSGHANARIELGTRRSAYETVFFVRDDGAGFDMAYVEKLFGPFQRLHRTEEFPGNGIGLATVQRIIARHGGRIWAEGAVEEGATFHFVLGQELEAAEAGQDADTA